MASVSQFLKYVLKYIALGGYVVVFLLSSYSLFHIPTFSLAAGVTFLSMFETPFSDYVFNWSLYALLVYMLLTYHEMDGCILEKCEQSDSSAFISIISTIIAWTSISDFKTKKNAQPKKVKVVQAVDVKTVQAVPVLKLKPLVKAEAPKVRAFPKLHWV
tara:strand:+ start:185 stop:661 length:477 start_codon:yes stop_codon:yes gene_type:complete